MVVIFIPKETAPGETRVAAVPETIKGLSKLGLVPQIQRGAGAAAGFSDADFYRELALPPDKRVLVSRRIELPEAAALFAEWARLEGRRIY